MGKTFIKDIQGNTLWLTCAINNSLIKHITIRLRRCWKKYMIETTSNVMIKYPCIVIKGQYEVIHMYNQEDHNFYHSSREKMKLEWYNLLMFIG